jgi:hypothetical protein
MINKLYKVYIEFKKQFTHVEVLRDFFTVIKNIYFLLENILKCLTLSVWH